MEKVNIKCDFSTSAISDIRDINSSFARARLKVMYLGANRNRTFFSRDAVQRALPSLRNVPVVCNWNYEEGTIGGHDMDVVTDSEGRMRLMNMTDPCGVVPDHAKFSFVTEVDESGVGHEYLVVDDIILWKRQDVFNHIRNDLDGKVDHSMEVNIFDKGVNPEGLIDISNFEFTALCLLERDAPCFEGSELELYSANNNAERFKAKFEQMLDELKEITPDTSNEVDNKISVEGGDKNLEEKIELIAKYGLKPEELDFAIEDVTVEELDEKLKSYSAEEPATNGDAASEDTPAEDSEDAPAEPAEPAAEPVVEDAPVAEPVAEETYALEQGFKSELCRVLETEKVTYEWGSVPRYCYVDYDKEASQVYAWDENDWLLYGFNYTVDGDVPVIDFASKARKKFAIVDFEGEQNSPFAEVYSQMNEKIKADAEVNEKYSAMETELNELREYKSNVELAATNKAKENILGMFADLQGEEAFEALSADMDKYDLETLEEKCYAIRGRMGATKYSLESKAPKTIIDKVIPEDNSADPYGGIIQKYNN